MKSRITTFFKIYFAWVIVFILQKPIFMTIYRNLMEDAQASDWFRVVWNGLTLDVSMAGYLTILPSLMLVASVWLEGKWLKKSLNIYFAVTTLLVSMTFVINIGLYDFWGFPLDSTPLFYFFSSPKDAFASVSIWFIILGLLSIAVCTAIIFYLFYKIVTIDSRRVINRIWTTVTLILLTGLLIIPIRGGVTVSTTNTGKVYFSKNQRINHAAVNPMFSLIESLTHQEDFAEQYRFMDTKDADKMFSQLSYTRSDSTEALINTRRPDVLIVIMESFSSKLMASLGGEKDVAVNLDKLAAEGVLFTNFYANSFRTDRGLVSILSGYPAQPTMSIMKYPKKTANLPSISGSLVKVGYGTKYYYGGDADFTNMRSYLVSSGFTDIISDVDFPVEDRMSKWGAPDHVVFNKLLTDLRKDYNKRNMFRVIQTSSSHEPFEVPYKRLKNERLNAFAYTDDCIGKFIKEFKKLPQWKNTLVILVPDHLGCYPQNISNFVLDRYKIPLIMTGGAVIGHKRVDTIGSQHDIAATLLGQMGIAHTEFTFSKDMMDNHSPHFAFFSVPDAFGMVTTDNAVIYDNISKKLMLDEGKHKGTNLKYGETYLQKIYDDISKR